MARVLRVFGAVVLTALSLTAAHAISAPHPAEYAATDPFVFAGHVGQDLDVRKYSVQVLGVRGGVKVLGHDGHTIDTGGVFVLVKIRVRANDKPVRIDLTQVRDSAGNRFDASERAVDRLQGTFQPGTPVEVEVTFEVPTASASGLTLRLSEASILDQFAYIAEIPLDITPAQVEQWRATPDSLSPLAWRIAT